MTPGFSSLAIEVPERRKTKIVTRTPWGIALHTTGRGVPARAAKTGKTVAEVALKIYLASQNGANGYPWGGPAYVIVHDGTIYQIAADTTRTNHIGSSLDKRKLYLSGAWMRLVSRPALARWHAVWGPRYKNPQQLFPSRAPNTDFVGIEMVPIGSGLGGPPMRPWLLFTRDQHDAAANLAVDIARRNRFPDGWGRSSRLLGHEDVGLLDRVRTPKGAFDPGGAWDPGFLRTNPYFDFDYVRDRVETLLGAV